MKKGEKMKKVAIFNEISINFTNFLSEKLEIFEEKIYKGFIFLYIQGGLI